ncbi:NlpC/P60 family protein [Isosphaeraceae bacterium EP7]
MPRSLFVFACIVLASLGLPVHAQELTYRSPYRVEFTHRAAEVIGDLERTERGDHRLESEVPFHQWYTPRTLERWHAWGPPAAFYPRPPGVEHWPAERKRERVIAVALRFQGYAYQHHHIPDWSPPEAWPWMPTCAGSNGKGVDCSNLTGFVYNQGFGLRLNSDVHKQSEERSVKGTDGRATRLHAVELPSSYDDRLATLRTGDLLFIRGKPGGKISHVVLWVGPIGRSPDGTPLVLDSHGEDVRDSEGQPIPCGVHLRPFRENSWYNRSASHALRVFID